MNIITTQYIPSDQSLEIYLAGCDGACKGCHNPQSWDFNAGKPIDWELLMQKVNSPMVKDIHIMGGEPLLHHTTRLFGLIYVLTKAEKPLWLWTRFEIDDVPNNIKLYVDYIKTGAYIEGSKPKTVMGITLASDNQKIYKNTVTGFKEVFTA